MSIGQVVYVTWHGKQRKATILRIKDGIPHVRFL